MPHHDAVKFIEATHPLFGVDSGWRRPPKGRTRDVVDILCAPRCDRPVRWVGDELEGLPGNDEIAAHLGISEKTVRDIISAAAREINGIHLNRLPARARIFVCEVHERWKREYYRQTPPVSAPPVPFGTPTPPSGSRTA
jgi:hypothetical protein